RVVQHDGPRAAPLRSRVPHDEGLPEGAAGGEERVGRLVGPQREVETAAARGGGVDPGPGGAAIQGPEDAGAGGGVDAQAVACADLDVVDVVEVGVVRGRRELLPGDA